MYKAISAEEAVKVIKSGDRVMIHSVAMAPTLLIKAMVARAPELRGVEIVHLHTEGEAPYADKKYCENFRLNSFFVGANVRKATQEGYADYIPVFLSEVPRLIRQQVVPINVAMIMVSPPNKHGYVSLGTSVDATLAGIENADVVIAQVNKFVPRSHGDALIHISMIDHFVEHDVQMHYHHMPAPDDIDTAIGNYAATLIEDGATLQMGIGSMPNAVLSALTNHKNLGIHTEMFSDGILPLVEKGVITNSQKVIEPGKIIASFVMGTQAIYDFMDDNPMVSMRDVAFVNDVRTIRQNPKVTAINSAIEVDLTGQVCADSIGTRHYSGVGGQMDFIRGASYSEGGKPIIALPSITGKGISRIVPTLKVGAGVVSTRANVHYIITEYGIAYLYGKPMRKRAVELMKIAHPDHREELDKAIFERFGPAYF